MGTACARPRPRGLTPYMPCTGTYTYVTYGRGMYVHAYVMYTGVAARADPARSARSLLAGESRGQTPLAEAHSAPLRLRSLRSVRSPGRSGITRPRLLRVQAPPRNDSLCCMDPVYRYGTVCRYCTVYRYGTVYRYCTVYRYGTETCGFPSQCTNQPRGYGHTTRAPPGVSLPSGSRTRNLRILCPAYKPQGCSGDTDTRAYIVIVLTAY